MSPTRFTRDSEGCTLMPQQGIVFRNRDGDALCGEDCVDDIGSLFLEDRNWEYGAGVIESIEPKACLIRGNLILMQQWKIRNQS